MRPSHSQKTRNSLPTFLIAGVAKAGTSSLYQYLSQHPLIYMPPHKEPYFFSFGSSAACTDPSFRKLLILDQDRYESLFSRAPTDAITGEASTSYLYTHTTSIPKIWATYSHRAPLPSIIIVLRNPIDRAFSHYSYLVRNRVERLSFEEAIRPDVVKSRRHLRCWDFDYVEYGKYFRQVQAYIEAFPRVRVFLFEDFARPEILLRQCLEFLELNADFVFDTSFAANPSGVPQHPLLASVLVSDWPGKSFIRDVCPGSVRRRLLQFRDNLLRRQLRKLQLSPVTRDVLVATFRDDILRLQDLLIRDLSHWVSQ